MLKLNNKEYIPNIIAESKAETFTTNIYEVTKNNTIATPPALEVADTNVLTKDISIERNTVCE